MAMVIMMMMVMVIVIMMQIAEMKQKMMMMMMMKAYRGLDIDGCRGPTPDHHRCEGGDDSGLEGGVLAAERTQRRRPTLARGCMRACSAYWEDMSSYS